jgi:uncharacterized protein YciI
MNPTQKQFSLAHGASSNDVPARKLTKTRRKRHLALCFSALTLAAGLALAQEAVDKRPTWFIYLETGKKTPDDKEAVQKMQVGHIQNFKRLFGEQKLFAAGPLRDSSGKKRGIVVVKAESKQELLTYFQPDEYVREGYLTANAERCVVHRPLNTEGIDPEGIEEVRIVQITRPAKQPPRKQKLANDAFLQALVDKGTVGGWYTLEAGAVAEVLFCRTADTKALEDIFGQAPLVKASEASVLIWPQWLGKGVVK